MDVCTLSLLIGLQRYCKIVVPLYVNGAVVALVVVAARLRQQRRRFPAMTTAVKDEARDGDFVTPDEVWNRDTAATHLSYRMRK